MAATGKTPILLYGSTTPTNAPVAGNLTNSSDGCEIAINVADKNLFFKDSTNAVNTVPIRQSSASSNGWLSSTDWSTFNSKVSSQWVTSGSNIYYSAGNVAIGTSTLTAGYKLDVVDTATNLRIRSSSTTSTDGPKLTFWHEGNDLFALQGGIDLKFLGGGSSELMRIGTSSGNVTVNTGNLVIGTSGKGIDFSATAGTGTSELLADYEEGTWTPTVTASSGTITTVGTATGLYRKVGNLVTIVYYIQITNNGTGAGELRATLPYAPLPSYGGVPAISYGDGQEIAVSGFRTFQSINGNAGTNLVIQTTANAYPASINGTVLTGSITYPTS